MNNSLVHNSPLRLDNREWVVTGTLFSRQSQVDQPVIWMLFVSKKSFRSAFFPLIGHSSVCLPSNSITDIQSVH